MVADLSPWGSPLTVWNRLTGLVTEERRPSLRMWLGERMEPIILDLFEARTGRRPQRIVGPNDPPILHGLYPFIGCHPDYDHLEIKTDQQGGHEWGEDGEVVTTQAMAMPLQYFLQVQHQMAVMGWDVIDVAVLLGHDAFHTYTVPADPVVIERLTAAEVELWGQAERLEMPAAHDPESRRAYLRARFPRETRPMRPATPEEVASVEEWLSAKRDRVQAERIEHELADSLRLAIGEHAGFAGLVSLTAAMRKTISLELLRAELRAIGRSDIERVTNRSEYRTLRVTKRTETG